MARTHSAHPHPLIHPTVHHAHPWRTPTVHTHTHLTHSAHPHPLDDQRLEVRQVSKQVGGPGHHGLGVLGPVWEEVWVPCVGGVELREACQSPQQIRGEQGPARHQQHLRPGAGGAVDAEEGLSWEMVIIGA